VLPSFRSWDLSALSIIPCECVIVHILVAYVFATNTSQNVPRTVCITNTNTDNSANFFALCAGISKKITFAQHANKMSMKCMVGETERSVDWASMYVANPRHVCRLGMWTGIEAEKFMFFREIHIRHRLNSICVCVEYDYALYPKWTVKRSLEALLITIKKVDLAVSTENTEYIFTSLEDKVKNHNK
jgi:hypothetical protein